MRVAFTVRQILRPALIGVMVLFGCGPDEAQDTSHRYGGEVMIGVSTRPDPLNPLQTTTTSAVSINTLIFSGLTKPGNDLFPLPDLAARWEVSQNKLRYTFYLRPGVKFHDGHELTSEDVRYTIEASWNSASVFSDVEYVEEVDRYTVSVNLKKIVPNFLVFAASFPIVPKHLMESDYPFAAHPIGTGPFKFESQTDSTTTLVVNEDYFRRRPYLDRVVFRSGISQDRAWASLLTHDIDLPLLPVSLQYAKRLPESQYALLKVAEPRIYALMYNTQDPILGDQRVRRAAGLHIYREGLVRRGLEGQAEVAVGPFGNNSWATDYAFDTSFDPDEADRLLDAAGWRMGPDGKRRKNGKLLEMHIVVPRGFVPPDAGSIIFLDLSRMGAEVSLEWVEPSELLRNWIRPGTYQVALAPITLGADPSYARNLFHSDQMQGGMFNYTRYSNSEIDALFDSDDPGMPIRKREGIYSRIQEILSIEQPMTFLYSPYSYTPVASHIIGIETRYGTIDLYSIVDWEDRSHQPEEGT